MKKLLKTICLALFIGAMFLGVELLRDKEQLRQQIVRLHVVADSDSAEDQSVKLEVKDAVVAYLQEKLDGLTDIEQVKEYLSNHLDALQEVAEETLERLGIKEKVSVSFEEEAFPVRYYDTFKLPSGIYQSLRIRIGQAQGHNWWCVVFPTLCIPQSGEEFRDVAAGSGFSDTLGQTLSNEEGYEVRFFLLDLLGWLENKFSGG